MASAGLGGGDTAEIPITNVVTSLEMRDIYQNCKTHFNKVPDFVKVSEIVANRLNVEQTEKLMEDIKEEYKNYTAETKKSRGKVSSDRKYEDRICFKRKDYVTKTKTPLTDISDRQQRRRLTDFVSNTKIRAEDEGVTPTKMYAYGLKNKYLEKREVGEIGKQLFNNNTSQIKDRYVSFPVAAAVYDAGKMTRRIYTNIRLLLKGAGADVLPPYNQVTEYRKERRPPVQPLDGGHVGLKFDYVEALKLATSQQLLSLSPSLFSNLNELHLSVHDGLDGSGGHSLFNQKGSSETNNIIMHMFRIENIKKTDGELVWTNPSHGSASSCRPVMLLMGKETQENCSIVADLQNERRDCSFDLEHPPINVKVSAKMSMVDGKLHSLLSGCGVRGYALEMFWLVSPTQGCLLQYDLYST